MPAFDNLLIVVVVAFAAPLLLGFFPGVKLPSVVLYRRMLDARHTAIAGLMQATSLPFIVAAVAIGEDLDLVSAAEGAALIGAGLLSVLLFPAVGLGLLRRGEGGRPAAKEAEASDAIMAM
jgi:hypothetical protein